jgi:uncharacterized protein YcbX
MTTPRVAALFVHPLKSAAAIPVESITLDSLGAEGDRRWMLVDSDGIAITARTQHALALIRPSFAEADRNGALMLAAPAMENCTVSIDQAAAARNVTVWDDQVPAYDAGDIAAEWCSEALGVSCRLVRLADGARRPLRPKYAGALPYHARHVMLSDGAPLLLLSVGSIEALNGRLFNQGGEAVDVARFRPNILIDGVAAHEEDTWRAVQIGEVHIGMGSPCTRCVMTTVDPQTGESGVEPLRTLAGYRRDASGVVFGMNATHAAPGVIRVGDTIEVTALR